MERTHIDPRTVFVVCCVAALPAVTLGSPQAGTQEPSEFDAFYGRSARHKSSYFEAVQNRSKPCGLAPPTPRFSGPSAGVVSMVGTRSDHDSTGGASSTRMGQ